MLIDEVHIITSAAVMTDVSDQPHNLLKGLGRKFSEVMDFALVAFTSFKVILDCYRD